MNTQSTKHVQCNNTYIIHCLRNQFHIFLPDVVRLHGLSKQKVLLHFIKHSLLGSAQLLNYEPTHVINTITD